MKWHGLALCACFGHWMHPFHVHMATSDAVALLYLLTTHYVCIHLCGCARKPEEKQLAAQKIEGEEAAEELERKRQELIEAGLREEALKQELTHAQVKIASLEEHVSAHFSFA